MLVNEVCKKTGLTKKAIEYYQQKGLISPRIQESGYRDFSESDLTRLKDIALYRKLGLNMDEIRKIMNSVDRRRELLQIRQIKENQVNATVSRIRLIEQLIDGKELSDIQKDLELLEVSSTIKEKLLRSFPGYFGRYFSFHFGQFLNVGIESDNQKMLYDRIVAFLDDMEPIVIPEELQSFMDQYDQCFDNEIIEDMNIEMKNAYEEFDAYWEQKKDSIIQYAKYKNTEDYKNSVIPKIMELFSTFCKSSGYYDEFIPAMRELSPLYDSYYKKMLEANEKLSELLLDIEL